MVKDKYAQIHHLNAEVTRGCNLSCSYCFNNSGKRENDELELRDWKNVIDISKEHGARSILLTGGEVMTRIDSPEIAGYSLENGLKTSILSNGFKINSQYKTFLQELDRIQISLDSASSYSHDSLRGDGSWKNARRAIDYMRSLNVPVEISVTIGESKINELEGLAGIAQYTGSKLLIRPLQNIGRASAESNGNFTERLLSKKRSLEEKFGEIFVEDFAHYVPILGNKHDDYFRKQGFLTVLPNGTIRGTIEKIFQLDKVA